MLEDTETDEEDVSREEVDVDERTTASSKGGASRAPTLLLPQIESAWLPWTTVSGEYEGDIDTTLTPLGAQYGATQGMAQQRNRLIYAGL